MTAAEEGGRDHMWHSVQTGLVTKWHGVQTLRAGHASLSNVALRLMVYQRDGSKLRRRARQSRRAQTWPPPSFYRDMSLFTARRLRAAREMADTAARVSARCQSSGAALGTQAYKRCPSLLEDKMSIEKDVPPGGSYARALGAEINASGSLVRTLEQ